MELLKEELPHPGEAETKEAVLKEGTPKETLQTLNQRDAQLRSLLETEFPDEEEFRTALAEIVSSARRAGNPNLTGPERARALAGLRKEFDKLAKTERVKISADFVEVSQAREQAQGEVEQLKKMP